MRRSEGKRVDAAWKGLVALRAARGFPPIRSPEEATYEWGKEWGLTARELTEVRTSAALLLDQLGRVPW